MLHQEMIKKVLYTRNNGVYITRTELIDGSRFGPGCADFKIKSAYAPNGDYLGDPEMATFLKQKGIVHFEKRAPESNICSIGYNPIEKKWYGWSHRMIRGFCVGDMAAEWTSDGTISEYRIKNFDEAKEAAKLFAASVS